MAGKGASLWPRPLALVAGLSVIMVSLFAFDLARSRRLTIEGSRAISQALCRLSADRFDASLREIDGALDALAERLAERGAGGRGLAEAIGPLLDGRPGLLAQLSGLSLVDAQGRLIASRQGSPPDAAQDSALCRRKPVTGPSGEALGSLSAQISPELLRSQLEDLDLGEHMQIALLDSSLSLMAGRPSQAAPSGTGGLRRLLLAYKPNGPGGRSLRLESGPTYYHVLAGKAPFFAVISESRQEVMGDWQKRLVVYSTTSALITLLMVLLARLFDRNLKKNAELAARLVAIESASDMIVIADLEGRAQYANPSFERRLGLSMDRAPGSRSPIFGDDKAKAEAALAAAAAGEGWRGEVSSPRADGSSRVEEVTIAPVPGPKGEPIGVVAILRDVTERRRHQDRLEQLAHYDSLTKLPNRALFLDRLEGALARARREERRFALLFIDLDGFKAVNDHHGHDAGDRLLGEIARRLRAAIRDSDTAGRMGGDEFTILLDNIAKPEDAEAVALKIRSSVSLPIEIAQGSSVTVGASVGLAVFPENGEDAASLMKAADAAMYTDKIAGGHG